MLIPDTAQLRDRFALMRGPIQASACPLGASGLRQSSSPRPLAMLKKLLEERVVKTGCLG